MLCMRLLRSLWRNDATTRVEFTQRYLMCEHRGGENIHQISCLRRQQSKSLWSHWRTEIRDIRVVDVIGGSFTPERYSSRFWTRLIQNGAYKKSPELWVIGRQWAQHIFQLDNTSYSDCVFGKVVTYHACAPNKSKFWNIGIYGFYYQKVHAVISQYLSIQSYALSSTVWP